MSPIPTPENTEEALPDGLIYPIEHMFMMDPLDLTEENLLLIAQHLRSTRLQFLKAEDAPKTVERSRGPKLDPAASKAKIAGVLASLIANQKGD